MPMVEFASLADAKKQICKLKFDASGEIGWSPRLRQRFGYYTPDEWYEAILFHLITHETKWLDVGCGADPFPSNRALASILSSRCELLVGLDPSDNIDRNPFVHERAKCLLEAYETNRTFDIISLRMVAEHIADPKAAVAALARLTKVGGVVILYTVYKWSPSSLMAAATPLPIHHLVKRLLWRTAPEDTFPTTYRMNTRGQLRDLFKTASFSEERFFYLDDCRSMARWYLSTFLELSVWRTLQALSLPYPEVCILGIYKKTGK